MKRFYALLVAVDARRSSVAAADVSTAVEAAVNTYEPSLICGPLPSDRQPFPPLAEVAGLQPEADLVVWPQAPDPDTHEDTWIGIARNGRELRSETVFKGPAHELSKDEDRILAQVISRREDEILIMAGGELNLLTMRKGPEKNIEVPSRLDEEFQGGVKMVLNLSDRYPRRWEGKFKLQFISRQYQCHVVCIWNQFSSGESAWPWYYFKCGEQTPIDEIDSPVSDVRLGLLDIAPTTTSKVSE